MAGPPSQSRREEDGCSNGCSTLGDLHSVRTKIGRHEAVFPRTPFSEPDLEGAERPVSRAAGKEP